MTYLIGLDIGTTTIKAVRYNAEVGRVVSEAARPTPTSHPLAGWSEHDPELLWQAAAACLAEVIAGLPVAGLAISSFAEAGLPLDAAGRPLYPIIAWYDRRSAPQAAWWESHLTVAELHAITGQRVSPSFGVNKWLWLRQHEPDLAARMSKWLSTPDYLLWRLTGEQATDYTLASRTLLLDQHSLDWSARMLALAELERGQLPCLLPGGTLVGRVTPAVSGQTGLPAGTPCVLGGHDHLCAALAAGAYQPGAVIDSSGTAQAVLMVLPAFATGAALAEHGFACYAHVIPGYYVLKGGLKAAGGAIDWLAQQLSGLDTPLTEEVYTALATAAASGAGRRAGPLWLPHLIGSGTPLGDAHSRAALVGLQIEHERGDIFRGLLESLAFWLRHNLEVMQTLTGQGVGEIMLLGGANRLRLLAQLKADVLNLPVLLPSEGNASAIGAALLAGLGTGVFASPAAAVASRRDELTIHQPDPQRALWYEQLYRQVYLPLYDALRTIHHTLEVLDNQQDLR
jgi:xylulokinase